MNPRTATTFFGLASLALVPITRLSVLPAPKAAPVLSDPGVGYIEGLNGLTFAYTKALLSPSSCDGCTASSNLNSASNANGWVSIYCSYRENGMCMGGGPCLSQPCKAMFTYSWNFNTPIDLQFCNRLDSGSWGCKKPKSFGSQGTGSSLLFDVACGHTLSYMVITNQMLNVVGMANCSACEEGGEYLTGQTSKSLPVGDGNSAPLVDLSQWSPASAAAAQYLQRDRAGFREAFLQASKSILSPNGLQQAFTIEDPEMASNLADLVQAEAAPLVERLEILADEYVDALHEALERVRHSMPPEVVDAGTTETSEEILKILVDMDGQTFAYRIRMSDDPALPRILGRADRVQAALLSTVAKALESATGGAVHRRAAEQPPR